MTTKRPTRGFVHKTMEVNGKQLHVQSINLQTVTVMENNRLQSYPLSSVNKMDLAMARNSFNIGTL